MDKLVSVIIPVYNVEQYIRRCVDSVIMQTYRNIEIILVDDGATDSSGIICDEYQERDLRVRIIHQANGGLSAARNAGIDIAAGEYIFFVDSDDYIMPETIDKLVTTAESGDYSVVACGIELVWDSDSSYLNCPFTTDKPGAWSGRLSVLEMIFNNNVCSVACNKLYRASLWKDIRFPKGRLHEDEFTTHRLLYKSKSVAFVPDMFYKYYQRDNGISAGTTSDERDDHLMAFYERYEFFKDKGDIELAEWSMVKYLEYIKYLYRNANSGERKEQLSKRYSDKVVSVWKYKHINIYKKIALMIWKYYKYK